MKGLEPDSQGDENQMKNGPSINIKETKKGETRTTLFFKKVGVVAYILIIMLLVGGIIGWILSNVIK